ncbi:hypothetical protein EV421DRAFT_1747162 [Armillaria borealis]|uniref:Uncharacterized protein n=1 Tax=Armillaria borealis TaxID=47425 RepID=A0AA39IEI7_9AGAR|nr:hypothetical protein EV421DRAFT_1747162 [Armillaria borealis]
MDFDRHIAEVTVFEPSTVINHFQLPAHHNLRPLPITIQWQHANADPSTLGPIVRLLSNVQTVIFRDTHLEGPVSLVRTWVQEVVLLNCSVTQESLLGLLKPWGSLSISGGRTMETEEPHREVDALALRTLHIDFEGLPPRQLEIVTIGFRVKDWADKSMQSKYRAPLREFDAQLFRLVDHFSFELLRLQLGSRWVGKKDGVIEFVQTHTPYLSPNLNIEDMQSSPTPQFSSPSVLALVMANVVSNEVTMYHQNDHHVFQPVFPTHTRPIAEILSLHPFQKTGTYPEGVRICLSRVVDISEDAEALFEMKADLVVYLSDYVTYHAKRADIETLIGLSDAVPWFEAWYDARTLFPFDWLAPYLQPGTRQYHNTPMFIHEKLQNVTHMVVVTTFLLAGYDHPVTGAQPHPCRMGSDELSPWRGIALDSPVKPCLATALLTAPPSSWSGQTLPGPLAQLLPFITARCILGQM